MNTQLNIIIHKCHLRYHTVVVGSGAAGFSAALHLKSRGIEDVAIVTEGINMGTSRNTGSDKQTYYKLSLSGDAPDSPAAMAQDLFSGQCVDGDLAYAEAAGSVDSFLRLVRLGVPFPVNEWGEYVGYRTDHDVRCRATSAGPLTSKMMTECLERAVVASGIEILDGYLVIQILHEQSNAVGLLALHRCCDDLAELICIRCENVIWATGGPAGIYADTVYPLGHHGSTGTALEAGAIGKNLTEWQYGLASIQPRWNVSGTYLQVLPRLVSIDDSGTHREFLLEHYQDAGLALSNLFRKGYEWPFDSRKAQSGSSVIDLLVYQECVLHGRRVYLDYRTNPGGVAELDYSCLTSEAKTYLEQAGACFGTPIERLIHMNAPAYELFRSKGVDLKTEMLEIRLCAQHCNGGLDVDAWWQTSLTHLFAVGEVAGTHGVYRPGGSALNAGQVGAQRAAEYIARHASHTFEISDAAFQDLAQTALNTHLSLCRKLIADTETVSALYQHATALMTKVGGAFRSRDGMLQAREELLTIYQNFPELVTVSSADDLLLAYQFRDALIAQSVYLSAMDDYAVNVSLSRGSAIYPQPDGICADGLDDSFRFCLGESPHKDKVQLAAWNHGDIQITWRSVRPLPIGGGVFETVWREFRERQNAVTSILSKENKTVI